MARAADMKKQIPKSDKKNRKEVMKKIEEMETELKAKHEQELANCSSESSIDSAEFHDTTQEEDEDEDEITPEKLLAQLALDEERAQEEQAASQKTQPVTSEGGKKKRNRRKEKLAQRDQKLKEMQQEAREEADVQPDLRKIELENLDQICRLRGLEQYDIKPDGHCLFASISDQLQIRHNKSQSIQELRSKAADYIRQNPDTFGPFLFDEESLQMREIEPYCVELESTAVWGGDMEILALANVFDCCISVLFSGRAEHKVNEDGANKELKLVYYKHSFGLGEHYNSLRDAPVNDSN